MRKNKITADICIDINNKTLKICKLEYFEDENNNFFYVFSERFFYNFWYLCEYINRSVSIISVYRKDVDFL